MADIQIAYQPPLRSYSPNSHSRSHPSSPSSSPTHSPNHSSPQSPTLYARQNRPRQRALPYPPPNLSSSTPTVTLPSLQPQSSARRSHSPSRRAPSPSTSPQPSPRATLASVATAVPAATVASVSVLATVLDRNDFPSSSPPPLPLPAHTFRHSSQTDTRHRTQTHVRSSSQVRAVPAAVPTYSPRPVYASRLGSPPPPPSLLHPQSLPFDPMYDSPMNEPFNSPLPALEATTISGLLVDDISMENINAFPPAPSRDGGLFDGDTALVYHTDRPFSPAFPMSAAMSDSGSTGSHSTPFVKRQSDDLSDGSYDQRQHGDDEFGFHQHNTPSPTTTGSVAPMLPVLSPAQHTAMIEAARQLVNAMPRSIQNDHNAMEQMAAAFISQVTADQKSQRAEDIINATSYAPSHSQPRLIPRPQQVSVPIQTTTTPQQHGEVLTPTSRMTSGFSSLAIQQHTMDQVTNRQHHSQPAEYAHSFAHDEAFSIKNEYALSPPNFFSDDQFDYQQIHPHRHVDDHNAFHQYDEERPAHDDHFDILIDNLQTPLPAIDMKSYSSEPAAKEEDYGDDESGDDSANESDDDDDNDSESYDEQNESVSGGRSSHDHGDSSAPKRRPGRPTKPGGSKRPRPRTKYDPLDAVGIEQRALIKACLIRWGMTQSDLAKLVGISKASVCSWMQGVTSHAMHLKIWSASCEWMSNKQFDEEMSSGECRLGPDFQDRTPIAVATRLTANDSVSNKMHEGHSHAPPSPASTSSATSSVSSSPLQSHS